MADNLIVKDGAGTLTSIATKDAGGAHIAKHLVTNDSGAPLDLATNANLTLLLAAIQVLAPASRHAAVTPGDATVLVGVRSLWIGGAGDIVVTADGVDVTYPVEAGYVLQVKAEKVKAATTATNIVAWF